MLHLIQGSTTSCVIGTLLGVALLGWSSHVMPQDGGAASSTRFESAMTLYERCHWHEAFEQLAALADTGHPEAARIALLMARRGTSLFGGHFEAGPNRRERWLLTATRAPIPTAQRSAE